MSTVPSTDQPAHPRDIDAEAIAIVRALADQGDPITRDTQDPRWVCAVCSAVGVRDASCVEVVHDATCPWQRAVALVEALDAAPVPTPAPEPGPGVAEVMRLHALAESATPHDLAARVARLERALVSHAYLEHAGRGDGEALTEIVEDLRVADRRSRETTR